MNSLHKPTLLVLALAALVSFATAGCNTMKGFGKDTEKAGEKIQDKASR
jgi:predicted small secreted protein